MSEPSADLDIPKYTGSADDGPVEDWFNLFELHATAASWSEREMVINFTDYVSGEAFKFYLTDIFENDESWQKIKEEMIIRFKDYDEDSLTTRDLKAIDLSCHNHQQSSSTKTAKSSRPFPFRQDLFKHPLTERHQGLFPRRVNLPPCFATARQLTSTPLLHHRTRVTEPSSALYSPHRTLGPPPGFPSLCSSVTDNAHLTPHTLATVGIQLRNSEYTQPSPGSTVHIHASEQSTCKVAQTEKQSQAKSDQIKRLSVSPSSSQPPKSPTNTVGSEESTLKHCPVPEASIKNGVARASKDLPVDSSAPPSFSFENHDNPTTTNYLLVTSTMKKKQARVTKGVPPRKIPQHQQCHQELKELRKLRQLHQAQRRTKMRSQPDLWLKDGRQKRHQLKERPSQHLSHIRRRKRQGSLLYEISRLHVQSYRWRYHHRKPRKRLNVTICKLQVHRHRIINFGSRERNPEAMLLSQPRQRIQHPRQKTRRLRRPTFKFYKDVQHRWFFAAAEAVSWSVQLCRTRLSSPERHSQPRPPELLRKPDCCTIS